PPAALDRPHHDRRRPESRRTDRARPGRGNTSPGPWPGGRRRRLRTAAPALAAPSARCTSAPVGQPFWFYFAEIVTGGAPKNADASICRDEWAAHAHRRRRQRAAGRAAARVPGAVVLVAPPAHGASGCRLPRRRAGPARLRPDGSA